ncbi:MAG: biosynthetic arginine decarboxylase [Gammaproteobacteria bacterium]
MKNIEKNTSLFNIPGWGAGYFFINEAGHLCARPRAQDSEQHVVLVDVAAKAAAQGLTLPILLRFDDILQHRAQMLTRAFAAAKEKFEYTGTYTAVYPIKVNQQRQVIDHVLATPDARIGLEAGSKPELMAVLALSPVDKDSIIICNGYKDREYIQLALIGNELGHQVYIIIEKISELEVVLNEAKRMNVTPKLGFRVRLASMGKGRWQNTGGEKAKFGLSSEQVLSAIETLREHNLLHCLHALHMHMGSQMAHIRDIQHGLLEVVRFYVELHHLGVNIQMIDIGGGLAVDYTGTQTREDFSMSYSIDEYAYNVVRTFYEACVTHELPQPHILTEAGRSMMAHHAVLITNIVDREAVNDNVVHALDEDEPIVLQELSDTLSGLSNLSPTEAYHNALHGMQEAQSLFIYGVLNLQQRAKAENLYHTICRQVRDRLNPLVRAHAKVIDELNEKLAAKVFANFSVFQSLPDAWALDQPFPILPLSRLDEVLTERSIIQDLTCDSDGQVELYVDNMGVETTLPLPTHDENKPYLLGFFLAGAYQEILGDMHNLFGDADSVHVRLEKDGSYSLHHAKCGDMVSDVLRYVGFDSKELLSAFRRKMAQTDLSADIKAQYLDRLEQGLSAYTYLG